MKIKVGKNHLFITLKKITKESIAEIDTNKLVKIWETLSPINFPKNPEIIEASKGKNKIKYSILSF